MKQIRIAIESIVAKQIGESFCFCNQKAIQTLEFVRGDRCELGSF